MNELDKIVVRFEISFKVFNLAVYEELLKFKREIINNERNQFIF